MLVLDVDPKLDRQFTREGPVLLWRDGEGGRRDGLLVVLHPCAFPTCPDRHVDLEVYRLTDTVRQIEVTVEGAWAIHGDGLEETLELDVWAAIELDRDDALRAAPDAPADVVAWLEKELDGELMAVVKSRFASARAAGEKALGKPIRMSPRVGRNEPCPCGSGKKFKRCCEGRGATLRW